MNHVPKTLEEIEARRVKKRAWERAKYATQPKRIRLPAPKPTDAALAAKEAEAALERRARRDEGQMVLVDSRADRSADRAAGRMERALLTRANLAARAEARASSPSRVPLALVRPLDVDTEEVKHTAFYYEVRRSGPVTRDIAVFTSVWSCSDCRTSAVYVSDKAACISDAWAHLRDHHGARMGEGDWTTVPEPQRELIAA